MAAGQTQVQLEFLHMKSKSVSSRLTEYSALMAAAAKINGKDLSSEQEMELRGGRQEVVEDTGKEVVENTGKEVVENTGKKVVEDTGKKVVEDTGKEVV